MSTFIDKLSGNVCYFTHFSVLDISGINPVTADTTVNSIQNNLLSNYKTIYFKETDSEALHDINIAQNFLHPNGLPFSPKRAIIGDFNIRHKTLPITNSTIMFTLYPEIGTACLEINLSFEQASTDQVVFLRQCSGNCEKFDIEYIDNSTDNTQISIKELCNEIISSITLPADAINTSYLLEINEFGDAPDLASAITSEPERVYGLLTGDEGWPFVGKDFAMSRITNNWGSRKFVKFIAFGTNFILFNLNKSDYEKDYEIHQKLYSTKYYGSMNEYFSMKSKFAGVNHGILFSLETVMAIKTVTTYILDKQTFFKAYQIENFNTAIQRTKAYRKDLMLTLNKLEQIDISEMGELENLVLKSQHIDPIIEKIKYLLELLESDLTLMYSQQTNKLVNFLTIFGTLLSVIGTIVAILDYLC